MKKLLAILVIATFVFAFADMSFAAAKGSPKDLVNYPANVVNESAKVVGKAAEGTAKTVTGTVQATGETLTGKPEKAAAIITTPVTTSAETIKDVAVGTVEMPVKAGEKTVDQR